MNIEMKWPRNSKTELTMSIFKDMVSAKSLKTLRNTVTIKTAVMMTRMILIKSQIKRLECITRSKVSKARLKIFALQSAQWQNAKMKNSK